MQLDLYIDTVRKVFVASPQNGSIFELPTLGQGDVITMRIRCLNPTDAFPQSYTPIPVTGRTLQVAIGARGGTPLASQYTWTPSANLSDPYFEADLNLNTSGINTLVANKDSADSFLQINLVDGTPRTVFLQSVTIESTVIPIGALSVPAPLTPISAEAVMALLRDLVCQSVTIQSPDLTHSRRLWETNAGVPRDDQSP